MACRGRIKRRFARSAVISACSRTANSLFAAAKSIRAKIAVTRRTPRLAHQGTTQSCDILLRSRVAETTIKSDAWLIAWADKVAKYLARRSNLTRRRDSRVRQRRGSASISRPYRAYKAERRGVLSFKSLS